MNDYELFDPEAVFPVLPTVLPDGPFSWRVTSVNTEEAALKWFVAEASWTDVAVMLEHSLQSSQVEGNSVVLTAYTVPLRLQQSWTRRAE